MEKIEVRTTQRKGFVEITEEIRRVVARSGVKDGVCFIFVPHTTAGITINENADPSVRDDILNSLNALVPEDAGYRHTEGNAPGHIRSSLLGNSLHIFIEEGRLCLGTWQGIFLFEGDGPRRREVWIKIL